MPQSKHKIVHNTHMKTKCMNCIVAVVIAILALVIHIVNNYLEEKTKIYPKVSSRHLLIEQKNRIRLSDKRIKR